MSNFYTRQHSNYLIRAVSIFRYHDYVNNLKRTICVTLIIYAYFNYFNFLFKDIPFKRKNNDINANNLILEALLEILINSDF